MKLLDNLTPITVPQNSYPYATIKKRGAYRAVGLDVDTTLEEVTAEPNKLVEVSVTSCRFQDLIHQAEEVPQELQELLLAAEDEDEESSKDYNVQPQAPTRLKDTYKTFEELAGQILSRLYADVAQYKPKSKSSKDKLPDSIAVRLQTTAMGLFLEYTEGYSRRSYPSAKKLQSQSPFIAVVSLKPQQTDQTTKILVEIKDNPSYKLNQRNQQDPAEV